MFDDFEEIFVEFGLEEVAIVKTLNIKHDATMSKDRFMHTAESRVAATSEFYDVSLETCKPVNVNQFSDNGNLVNTLDVMFTGITIPKTVSCENAIITTKQDCFESSKIEFTATDVTTQKLF